MSCPAHPLKHGQAGSPAATHTQGEGRGHRAATTKIGRDGDAAAPYFFARLRAGHVPSSHRGSQREGASVYDRPLFVGQAQPCNAAHTPSAAFTLSQAAWGTEATRDVPSACAA